MNNIIDAVYSQNVSNIDSNIDSLIDQQFSSFYHQYSDFSIISNFLSYRTKAYLSFLQNFTSMSKIFPVNLRYNLGLSNLINIKYTQYDNINLYEYIVNRGSKKLFEKIAKNLKLENLEQLVLTSVDPYVVIGSKSKQKYGTQILSTSISDIDLVNKEDIPVFLPIYSIMNDIKSISYEKFEILLKGLLFDKSEHLYLKFGPNTLDELILSYFVIKSIRKSYTPVDEIHYNKYRTKIVLPHQVIDFKRLMYSKFPLISELDPKEQWSKIFKPFITEYPIFTNLFRINTSNQVLNDQINNDIVLGDFITRLNIDYIDQINSITEYDADIYSSIISTNPELKEIYFNQYILELNPMYFLKNQLKYRTLYGNLLNYLSSIELKDIFLVDMILLIENIVSVLQSIEEYSSIDVDSSEIAYYYYRILSEDFVNFTPMYITLTTPNYVVKYDTTIYYRSSISKYPRFKIHQRNVDVKLVNEYRCTETITEKSILDIYTSMFTTVLTSNHVDLIEYIDYHKMYGLVMQNTFIESVFEHNAVINSKTNANISIISEYDMTRIVPKVSTIDVDLEMKHTYHVIIDSHVNTSIIFDTKYRADLNYNPGNSSVQLENTAILYYYDSKSTSIQLISNYDVSGDWNISVDSDVEYQHEHTETTE